MRFLPSSCFSYKHALHAFTAHTGEQQTCTACDNILPLTHAHTIHSAVEYHRPFAEGDPAHFSFPIGLMTEFHHIVHHAHCIKVSGSRNSLNAICRCSPPQTWASDSNLLIQLRQHTQPLDVLSLRINKVIPLFNPRDLHGDKNHFGRYSRIQDHMQ